MSEEDGRAASRRHVITGLAGLAAGILAPGRGSAQPAAAAKPRLIDTHHHYYPPEIIRAWGDYSKSHGGGPLGKQIAPDGVMAELQRLYYDTANAAWPVSLTALLKLVPPSQVLFGTDFPYVPTAVQRDALAAHGLPEAALAAVQRGNAARLIPRLSA